MDLCITHHINVYTMLTAVWHSRIMVILKSSSNIIKKKACGNTALDVSVTWTGFNLFLRRVQTMFSPLRLACNIEYSGISNAADHIGT